MWQRLFHAIAARISIWFRPAKLSKHPGHGRFSTVEGGTGYDPGLLNPGSAEPPITARSHGTGFAGWSDAFAESTPDVRRSATYAPTTDARVGKLRRAAVINLFELLGLGIVPRQCWPVLEAVGNPVLAVVLFLEKLGVDASALRDGDPLERHRAEDVLELLVDIADAFDALSVEARHEVEAVLYSGDYDRVRDTAELVRIYQRIAVAATRWPATTRFPVFEQFLAQLTVEMRHPMHATLEDAREAEAVMATLTDLLDRLAGVRVRHATLRDWLNGVAPGWRGGPFADSIIEHAASFEARDISIATAELSADDVATLITDQEVANDRLEALVKRVAGKRTDGAAGSKRKSRDTPPPPETALAKALAYFGMDALVDLSVWKTIRRRFQMKTHPDRGGSDAAFIEFTEHKTVIDQAMTRRRAA